ncbi:hypothetical protein BDV25DRAFT_165010 [Aspergillus avenaceus]|uniref:Uncharacterized protein n=1 Tax=Aspergillus avenaceus TaxID=36643 RepID=A0A5N6TFX2_ASPAV|nr:hypothetical protein BDV25DRAFT_165010 [Aspergillus avenaceus]
MWELFSVRSAGMVAFLGTVQQTWGGVEGYLVTYLGFSGEEIEIMRKNLKKEYR